MKRFAVLALLAASPVLAQSGPMGEAGFSRYVEGRTIYYSNNGQPYGVEQYLPNRQVRWSFLDGQCKDGYWYQQEQFICFVYEDDPTPQCWTFFDEGRLRALYEDDPSQTELFEIEDADEPMLCLGPDIGV